VQEQIRGTNEWLHLSVQHNARSVRKETTMLGWGWFLASGLAFCFGIVWLAVSSWVGYQLLRELLPLLSDTRHQIQDLGDLAANTVGRASDTMEIVEMRVSETMGQATQAGVSVTKQALGFGSALAGLYMISRVASLLRGQTHKGQHGRGARGRGRNRR
jgi:hypothetical protein